MRIAPENSIAHTENLIRRSAEIAHPLATEQDLDPLLERIGNARYVLLGEATHGTSEFYVWRSWLSRRLIAEKGFSFLAVEGDWPNCHCVNRYLKNYTECGRSAREVLQDFERWPTWMWANWEIVALVEWLREYNDNLPSERKVGFYGLDVYSLWESIHSVLNYLERVDGKAVEAAKRAFRCFEPYAENAYRYAHATNAFVPTTCENEVIGLLASLRQQVPPPHEEEREAFFVAEQNALVVKNAETY